MAAPLSGITQLRKPAKYFSINIFYPHKYGSVGLCTSGFCLTRPSRKSSQLLYRIQPCYGTNGRKISLKSKCLEPQQGNRQPLAEHVCCPIPAFLHNLMIGKHPEPPTHVALGFNIAADPGHA